MQFGYYYKPGQSIVLLALMLVVIIGFVALSVDVGNAYAEQRRVQSAANAGALAGMNAVLEKQPNAKVWENVKRALAGNRIQTNRPEYTYNAEYIRADGTKANLGSWNGTGETIASGSPPNDVQRVRVTDRYLFCTCRRARHVDGQ
jgi:uncharacterized membrane protein